MSENRKDWASFFEQVQELHGDHAFDYEPPVDMVNKPKHYILNDDLEVKDVREALLQKIMRDGMVVPHEDVYDWITAWEYVTRALFKNGVEDMQKAIWYLNSYIARVKKRGDYVYKSKAD